MFKRGIINPKLNKELSYLGHTDLVVFADSGLPIPRDVATVDLTVTFGLPTMADVMRAVMAELIVEGATVATESSAAFVKFVQEAGALNDDAVTAVSHDELKAALTGTKLIIRTGETTPFANVIFRCGVPF